MSDAPLSIAEANTQMMAPGQMFETERTSINGIEMTVWKHAPANLRQILDLSMSHAERDFLVYEGQRFTFDDHYRTASTLAARLLDAGVTKGDRVAIASRNLPQWIIAFWATIITGAVSVPINAWWTPEELQYGLNDSGSSFLFVDEERLERVRTQFADLGDLTTVVVISEDPSRRALLGASHERIRIVDFNDYVGTVDPGATPPDIVIEPEDDATMFYTSGTTGHPKGAVGSHRNAVTNLMNLFFVGQRSTLRFGTGNVDEEGKSIQNAGLLSVPLFHATGCLASMITATAAGGKLVMMHHFDAGKALALIEAERLTTFGGVPTIAMQILDHPDFKNFDTSSVKSVSYGGAPAPPDLVKRIGAAFPGGQAGNGYGLT
jgi:long-chain acyl-CoA synthetase